MFSAICRAVVLILPSNRAPGVHASALFNGALDECTFLWGGELASDLCSEGHRVV
jgi:hypothetical protein